jgi:chromosome segregation ATPase
MICFFTLAWFSLQPIAAIVLVVTLAHARLICLQGALMPPVDKPKSDPLIVLLDEIEILSAQTRLMELYLKRAHTAAFGEVEKLQEEFRAKVTNLKAKLEDKENTFSKHLTVFQSERDQFNAQNQELFQRIAEQQKLIHRHQEESEQRGAEIVSLQKQIADLKEAQRELQDTATLRVEGAQDELKSQVAQLQTELEQKEQALVQRQSAISQLEQSAQAKVLSLEEELARSHESAERQRIVMERVESECHELRQRLAQMESINEQIQAQAGQDLEAVRQDAQAKVAALQSEIVHKTTLLTRNQATIAGLEQELKASADKSRSQEASKGELLENYAAEISRRDANIATLSGRFAELESLAQQQRLAAADELSQVRKTFAAELAALRSELSEKQKLLEQGRGVLQNVEQELRNRNRELQGQLAAKESVVESQEDNLRHAHAELLVVRDALLERERGLAAWQVRVSEQEQIFQAERNEWQSQLAEKQLLVEGYAAVIERMKGEIAQTRQAFESENGGLHSRLESQQRAIENQAALHERAQGLATRLDAATGQLAGKQAELASQSETLRQSQAQVAELTVALSRARETLDDQQMKARCAEQDLATRIAELRAELERTEDALRERDSAASRAEPAFKAQIEHLESRLNEKDLVLETRSREIAVLQARVESLAGQATRLEAAHAQALADAARESDRAWQARQAESSALKSESEKQQALLEDRQAALREIEQKLRAEINVLNEQSSSQERVVETQSAQLRQAEAEANALRERISELEGVNRQGEDNPVHGPDSDAHRIAVLEQKLRFTEQTLAERDAALQRMEQQLQSHSDEPTFKLAEGNGGGENQGEQLRAAQERIAELLERLGQLEAARHTLQENASHELQQLRDSFEMRIAKLRMELAAKHNTPPKDQSPQEQRAASIGLQEDYQRQIQELQGQLVEKHSLLENRNEELIKVKAEMDALQDHLMQVKASRGEEAPISPFSVELREEDAVEIRQSFTNGQEQQPQLRPDPLQLYAANGVTILENGATGHDTGNTQRTNRFTHLEGRVRSWTPETEKDSAFGASRRWHMGMFKRRWKS